MIHYMNDCISQVISLRCRRPFMKSRQPRPTGAAFLLAQLGAHAADRFGERIKKLRLAPRHAGILRIIEKTPSCNQRALAKKLRVLPSRMVILIDELAGKGLGEPKPSTKDPHHSEPILTPSGPGMLGKLSQLPAQPAANLCAGL